MALPKEVEAARQEMVQAQEAMVKYAEGGELNPEQQKKLSQNLRTATENFMRLIERLR
jgi:hypothetical protein